MILADAQLASTISHSVDFFNFGFLCLDELEPCIRIPFESIPSLCEICCVRF